MKALLLDLDDTLLSYSAGIDESWAQACGTVTLPVEAATLLAALTETRKWFWGRDAATHARERVNMLGAWTKIAVEALTRCGCADADLAAAIAHDYAGRRRQSMRLYPETRAVLDALRARGLPLALVTNGDAGQQRDKIVRHDLARYFGDAILIEGEFGCGKPEVRVYREALRRLGAAPETTWMVGDNLEWDVTAPQQLGLTGVWIDRGGTGLPADAGTRPHRIIRSLAELLE
ncbi:MAG TPA: HAD family hydrolase [Methylomirabilota bacterium]|nr:HAD family hydrolase [Methylomirabilota bacterium]